jgi:hypothetical protein
VTLRGSKNRALWAGAVNYQKTAFSASQMFRAWKRIQVRRGNPESLLAFLGTRRSCPRMTLSWFTFEALNIADCVNTF